MVAPAPMGASKTKESNPATSQTDFLVKVHETVSYFYMV